MRDGLLGLFLCGDVMLGRGVDQILPQPGDPALREAYVRDARTYVELAEQVNGPIQYPVDYSWPWGDALPILDEFTPDARIVNLETSVTRSDDFALGKAVHYRMNPANLPCLSVARPDACVLANNHVLDFGRRGLAQTLDSLYGAQVTTVGAGRDLEQAQRHAVITVDGFTRFLVYAVGMATGGVPASWAATPDRSGVDFADTPSDVAADDLITRIQRIKQPGNIVVVSIHWGPNWGYAVSRAEVRFAHRLIDGGVDVVHGHSSHHPRPIEIYRGKLILYGCGDFIDDYEGITGYEEYRDDLRLIYLVSVQPGSGELASVMMVPLQARQLRLHHASTGDAVWMRTVLERVSHNFGTRIDLDSDGRLILRLA
ncbi:MAG TPA: CapA family protein [Jiangellaceae bacterium]|nr:CapA family protein [Jiangellaceae bacterium]